MSAINSTKPIALAHQFLIFVVLILAFTAGAAAQTANPRSVGVRKTDGKNKAATPADPAPAATPTPTPQVERADVTPARKPVENKRKIIVVLDFDDATLTQENAKRQMGKQIAILLSNKFNETGNFIVVERQQLAEVFDQIKLSRDERFDKDTAVKVGKATSASIVVLGTITEYTTKKSGSSIVVMQKVTFSAKIGLAVRLVDVKTAQVLDSVTVSGEASQKDTSTMLQTKVTEWDEDLKVSLFTTAANRAVDNAVASLVKLIDNVPNDPNSRPGVGGTEPVVARSLTSAPSMSNTASTKVPAAEAKIASVNGAQIYISGLSSSCKIGDRFNVKRVGNVIKDPDSGEVLDIEMQQIAVVEVTEVRERVVVGKIVSGTGVKVKDVVKPIQ
jgi:curli biogenesis system outer membrane secretion channel CsgG